MKKLAGFIIITVLILAHVVSASAAITTKITIDDSLFAVYSFKNLDQEVYEQSMTQLSADTIPNAIVQYLRQKNENGVQYGLPPQPLTLDNATNSISASFILSGSDIVSFTINQTTFERTYQVKTDWMKFKIELTGDFSIDFSQLLTIPVSSWQRMNYTDAQSVTHPALFNENMQTGSTNVSSTIILPPSAVNIHFQGDTIVFDLPPRFEDQVLGSPFIILAGLIVALTIILIYRKAR